ncbi:MULTISPECIES: DUF3105 domain-containing protein [Kocuria]|uniref:DUF3105 domain-containing protein n=1 Tax=Kocuria TaxID=57493 RepID=UPI001EEFF5EF|nr:MULTISPECIES: DUF3105 domain-containing protein [Kocuria]WJZ68521.1 DUF3105 domain-containing protein [Kocuria rosea]
MTAVAAVAALVAVAVINDPPPQAREDIEIAGLQTFGDLGNSHVEAAVDYEQAPPVGGDHASAWLNCGVYTEPVPEENAVHALEHGAVWAAYDPSALSEDQVEALRQAVPDTYVVLSPYEDLGAPIMVSAWGAQVAVDSPEDERLEQFVTKYWQSPEAPEPGASCTGGIDAPSRVA